MIGKIMKQNLGRIAALMILVGTVTQEAEAIGRTTLRAICGSVSAVGAGAAYYGVWRNRQHEDWINDYIVGVHSPRLESIVRLALVGLLTSAGAGLYRLTRGFTPEHQLDVVQADLDILIQKNPLATLLPKDGVPFLSMIEGMYQGESGIFKAAVDLREWQVKLAVILDTLANVRKEVAGDQELTQQCETLITRARKAIFNITAALERIEKHIEKSNEEFSRTQNA
jgi:hypothetical protein